MIAIDLGSNTLRCITYDCDTKEWGEEYEAIVKTAENLHVNKTINENALKRVIDAIKKAQDKLDFASHEVCAVTTEAMRQALNSDAVLKEIYVKTGLKFEIIDGDKEARYTTKAVKNRLDILALPSSSFALVDIGGGSTEIIFYDNGIITSKSFNIGIVTLTDISGNTLEIQSNLEKLLIPVKEYINSYYKMHKKPDIFVQTAGTPTTIAGYLQGMNYNSYDPTKINGYKLDVQGCKKVMNELLDMEDAKRSFYVGVGREDLIISGIIIVEKLYEALGYESSVVIDDGLREGIALSSCEKV
ncbi:phosphatase [Sulfurimonas sp. HSL-1716]|uniref:Ppx/GppA phosphatase family protein n=1 Tax=Hydrocurvibacter sulfurireducens TaxID=3131937 RepID=UPI0031F95CC8